MTYRRNFKEVPTVGYWKIAGEFYGLRVNVYIKEKVKSED